MKPLHLRDLRGSPPTPDRIALISLWFRGHNNPRYAELLPRLDRLDAFFLTLPDARILRGIGYRIFKRTKPAIYRNVLGRAARRYANLLSLDFDQLGYWPHSAVMDADDPFFTPRELALLQAPSLRAYVVTAEHAARQYEALGVEKPWIVIPQGVNLTAATPELRKAAGEHKRPGELVVGWMAAHLLTAGDPGSESPLYNVDHMLELWDAIRSRVAKARLWLIGGPSGRLRARLAGRADIELFGRLPRAEALATASCFDVSLYARTADQGIRAAKISELIGLGVPTVSYDYEVTANLRETGAGVLAADPRAFVDAVVHLLEDDQARAAMAAVARSAGLALDWDVLARRFETEVLDRYLVY